MRVNNVFLVTILLSSLLASSFQTSTSATTYRAGVVDYNILSVATFDVNVKNYLTVIAKAKENNVDILIFPEYGLLGNSYIPDRATYEQYTTEVPDPEDKISPCTSKDSGYSSDFKQLSCAAKTNSMNLVINIPERLDCNPKTQKLLNDTRECAPDKYYFFNTNVAFDRTGTVIGRYRKFNLYGEYLNNNTVTPEISTFTTDFNVKFGMFTCFDIIFKSPPLELTWSYGITDIIFPNRWSAGSPFLSALQVQEGWSFSQQVNMLAAGVNEVLVGSGGSGIYHHRNDRDNYMYISGNYDTTLLITDVEIITSGDLQSRSLPKTYPNLIFSYSMDARGNLQPKTTPKPDPSLFDNFELIEDELSMYSTKLIDTSRQTQSTNLCNNLLCCDFSVTISPNTESVNTKDVYSYRFLVYNGLKTFSGVANNSVTACGIASCTNSSVLSCGVHFPKYSNVAWPITFEDISIQGNFEKTDHTLDFPTTLTSGMYALPKSQWSYVRSDSDTVTMKLLAPQTELMTFAIWGRDFSKDE